VLPGIGRLIKRLDARVVVCRIQTGHLIFPRWADYPRWVPLQMDYSEALTWPAEATAEEITADIDRLIRIEPEPEIRGLSFGWRMAWGLPTYLWACPVCFEPNALQVHPDSGNAVRCAACGCAWTLDTSNHMRPRGGEAPALSVFTAYDRIRDHFGDPPALDRERFEREGVILDDESVHLGRILKGGGTEPENLGSGRLELRADGLRLYADGPEPSWSLDLETVKAVSFEFGGKLQVRTAEAVFQIDPMGTSRIQWADFLRPWWSAARERSTASPGA
jgi:hypothetical protein